jgi:hypothetical protein
MANSAIGLYQPLLIGERRLHEQLRAMRHLRPGTQMPQPTGAVARDLLADLLRLPDATDPLAWLRNN